MDSYCTVKAGDYCYPWRVENRQGAGRGAVATRDIACHELVLEDEPVGLSPAQEWYRVTEIHEQ